MVRRLAIMGSGETTAGMLAVHRRIFAGLPEPARCLLMDSPFAFQENADELVERIGGYFAESLGRPLRRVSLAADSDALAMQRALQELAGADWVFAGPGSPSYARRCWSGSPIPQALADVVAPGRSGALVLASAAAATIGHWALPVYEIYKVGEDPRWEPGLAVLDRVLGWRCAVVPHYDNQEGGTHDTRFCYLGARRLARIEDDLAGGFILGVDEHTALVLDLAVGEVWVSGRGGVTLRAAGAEQVMPAGTRETLADLQRRIGEVGAAAAVADEVVPHRQAPDAPEGPSGGDRPDDLARRVLAAVPEADGAARAAVAELLDRAEASRRDRDLLAELVGAVLEVRAGSRSEGDWSMSDRLRDALGTVGVEVRDSRQGSTWTRR